MDMSSAWLSQLEMQDHQGLMNQYQMIRPYHVVGDFSTVDSFSSDVDTKNPPVLDQTFQIPSNMKEMPNIKRIPSFKTTSNIINKLTPADEDQNIKPKPTPLPDVPNTFTISFGDVKRKDEVITLSDSFGYANGTKKGPTMIRNRIQLQDHMLAERKRREKLARRFVYLSSLLPGLKKMDKATVLEDAANYIQELQCRLKELEGSSNNLDTNNLISDISAKKPKLSRSKGEAFSVGEVKFEERHSSCSPEIEVRMSGTSVLVRIYCQKNYLSLFKVLSEMQKLDLSVTSSSTLPFGSSNLIITIVAKKTDKFLMTSNDLVKNLQLAISTLKGIQSEVRDCHSNKMEFEYNRLDEN